jgi:CRISPR-associated protein Cas1
VLQRALRDHAAKMDALLVEQISKRLYQYLEMLQKDHTLDRVRGFEGDAAHAYFNVFDQLIIAQKEDFSLLNLPKPRKTR